MSGVVSVVWMKTVQKLSSAKRASKQHIRQRQTGQQIQPRRLSGLSCFDPFCPATGGALTTRATTQ